LSGRAIAEIYRSIQHSGEILDPLLPPSAAHLPRQASVARTLAIAHRRANGPRSIDTVGIRESYLAQRLEGGEGQIAYYGGQARRAQKRRRRVKAIFRLATTLALLSTVVALVSLLGGLPGTEAFNDRWVAGFASFAFPALAAAAVGYLGLSETTRRADYYAEMARALERQRDLLAALRSESAIKETIRETENLLLEEFAGWLRRQVY